MTMSTTTLESDKDEPGNVVRVLVTIIGKPRGGLYDEAAYECGKEGELLTRYSFLAASKAAEFTPDRIVVFGSAEALSEDQKNSIREEVELSMGSRVRDQIDFQEVQASFVVSEEELFSNHLELFRDATHSEGVTLEVFLDLTHGYRMQPMIMLLAALRGQALGDFSIAGVSYGQMETVAGPPRPSAPPKKANPDTSDDVKKETSKGRIVDLRKLVDMSRWADAMQDFNRGGRTGPIGELLSEVASDLKKAATKEVRDEYSLKELANRLNEFDRLADAGLILKIVKYQHRLTLHSDEEAAIKLRMPESHSDMESLLDFINSFTLPKEKIHKGSPIMSRDLLHTLMDHCKLLLERNKIVAAYATCAEVLISRMAEAQEVKPEDWLDYSRVRSPAGRQLSGALKSLPDGENRCLADVIKKTMDNRNAVAHGGFRRDGIHLDDMSGFLKDKLDLLKSSLDKTGFWSNLARAEVESEGSDDFGE